VVETEIFTKHWVYTSVGEKESVTRLQIFWSLSQMINTN